MKKTEMVEMKRNLLDEINSELDTKRELANWKRVLGNSEHSMVRKQN